jgi:hypothetical protein
LASWAVAELEKMPASAVAITSPKRIFRKVADWIFILIFTNA